MKFPPFRPGLVAGIAAAAGLLVAGCATLDRSGPRHQTASVVEFLYGGRTNQLPDTRRPVLALPLRIGIAFVPSGESRSPRDGDESLPDDEQRRLLESVAAQFRGQPFVASIEVIPSAYLRPRGGFENLDQIRGLNRVDEMVLVSYDQMQFTDNTALSLTFWTLVGPYLVPSERNVSHVFLDAAVFDVASRRMLFRAPGTARVAGVSTLVERDRVLRGNAAEGFRTASTNLVANLRGELARFQDRLKTEPETAEIVHRPGYTGGGAVGLKELAGIGALAAVVVAFRRRD
jgi:rhombotail lipoprotein